MYLRTGTPGLGRGLVASLFTHSVRLSLVLRHASVNRPAILISIRNFGSRSRVRILDDIWTNWCLEDIGQRVRFVGGPAIGANDGDDRSRGHCYCEVSWRLA